MLKKLVGEILRTPAAKIDEHRSLYDMGLDSLMGVELSTAVEARFAVRLPVMALSENPTIARLSAQIISQLNGSNGADEVHVNSEAADQVRHMAAQHAEELHADVVALTASKLQSEELAASSRMIH
jgi:acyl carrier protein